MLTRVLRRRAQDRLVVAGFPLQTSVAAPAGRVSLTHVPAIEGVRAIAVAAVVVFHLELGVIRGGFLGVDLFFTLSGFLITRLLLAEYADTGRVRLLDFYDRRFRRLLPAALTMILVVVSVQDVFGSAIVDPIRRADIRSVVLYVANWHFIASAQDYFGTGPDISPLRHMWSLAIEEQFYVVWPLVTFFVLRAARSRSVTGSIRWLVGVTVLLTGVSATMFAMRHQPGIVSRAYYGTDTRAFQLLLGAVAAGVERDAVGRGVDRWRPAVRHAVVLICLVGIMTGFVVVDAEKSTYYLGGGLAFSVIAAVLVYQLSRLTGGAVVRALSWSPVVVIGALSYGIYLWHWPMILWITEPPGSTFIERRMVNMLQVAATMAAAYTSFRLIEQPIRSGRFVRRVPAAGRLAGMALPIVGVLLIGNRLLAPPPSDPILDALGDTSVMSCPNDEFPCVIADFRPGGVGPTVAVVGDSTVQGLTMGILDDAEEHGWRIVNAARGACPIGHLVVQYSGTVVAPTERQVQCYDMHPQIWADLVANYHPDVYLLGSISDRLIHVDGDELVMPATDQHLAETRSALVEALSQLAVDGAPMVYVESVPRGFGVDCYEETRSEAACSRPVADDAVNAPYDQLVRDVAAGFPTPIHMLNLTAEICGPEVCPLRVDGIVTRYDGVHFTGTMSRRLGPLVVQALVATGAVT